LISTNKIN